MLSMSIFNKINDGFHQIDRKVNEGFHVVDRKIGEAVHQVDGVANKAVHTVEGAANQAAHKVEGVANTAVHTVEAEAQKAVHAVEGEIQEAVQQVTLIEQKAVKAVQDAEQQAVQALTKELPDELKKLAEKLEEGISKKGIQLMKKLVSSAHSKMEGAPEELKLALNEVELGLTIGPITANVSMLWSRAEDLLHTLTAYENEPPAWNKGDILAFIGALSPNTVSIQADVELSFVVVSSSSLAIGGQVSIPSSCVEYMVGELLTAIGVPD